MADGLLRCCRNTIWLKHDPIIGQVELCNHCGADLVFTEHGWDFDTRSFEKIRRAYEAQDDSGPAARAYKRLLTGEK